LVPFEEVKDSLGDRVSIIKIDVDKTSKSQSISFVGSYNDFISKRKTVVEQSGVLTKEES
jgi:thioredoxin 1